MLSVQGGVINGRGRVWRRGIYSECGLERVIVSSLGLGN